MMQAEALTGAPDVGRREGHGSLADWLVVLLLTGAGMFAFVDRFVLSLLLEPIKLDLDLSDKQLGLLNGVAFGLFYAALGLPLGWLADRWSRKGTIVAGMVIWSTATACCGFATGFLPLMLARIGVGAGEAGLVPASYAIIHDRFHQGRANVATGVFQVGGFLGIGLAMVSAGYVYAFFMAGGGSAIPFVGALQPWQQTFVAAALPGPFFILAMLFLRENRRRAAAHGFGGEAASSRIPASLWSIYALLFIGTACVLSCSYAMMSWLPAILSREAHWTPQTIGLRYGLVMLFVATAGVLAGAVLAERLQQREGVHHRVVVPLLAAVLSLPLLLLIPFAAGGARMLALAACLHFVLALPMGVVPSLIQRITPADRRSFVSSIYVLACNVIGLGLGPVLIGVISDLTPGTATALRMALFYMMVPMALVAIASLYRLRSILRGIPAVAGMPSGVGGVAR